MSISGSTSLTPVERNPLKADFRNFLYVVWKWLNLPEPTPVQYDIAYYLQHGPKRRVIEAFRGVGKSWITSAYVVWRLYCDPQLNFLVVSASKERADQFSIFTQQLIMGMDLLAHLRPRPEQRFSKISFDVGPAEADHAPSVKSTGINGQLAGSRADEIVADDVEVPNNSDTQVKRDKLLEAIKEFDAILKPIEGSKITYLGTPQSEQSIYNALPDRGYEVRIWPAQVPDEARRVKYAGRLAPMVEAMNNADEPTDPQRFDNEDLMARSLSYGKAGYSLQFMLDTSLADADRFPLKLSDLIVFDLDRERAPVEMAWGSTPDLVWPDLPNVGLPGDRLHRPFMVSKDEWGEYSGIVMSIDPSGRGTDETAYAVVAFLHGRLFLLDAGAMPGGYDTASLTKLAQIAKFFKVHRVIPEPNFGDGMFTQLLEPVMNNIYPCTIEEADRSQTQKECRIIDTIEPVMATHRLIVDRSLIEKDYRSTEHLPPEQVNRYRLFYQMTRITRDKGSLAKDDRLDALAMAVHYWVDQMDQDTRMAAEAERAARLEHELTRFMDNIMNTNNAGRNPNVAPIR